MLARTEEAFIKRVAAHAGCDVEAVTAALHATLSVLGAHVTPSLRELIAAELTPSLGSIVVRAEAGTTLPIREHILTPEMTVARADELIASVFTVLADELSDDLLPRLRRELPEPLARKLVRPSVSHPVATSTRRTLAEGRPGSRRPIAEEDGTRAQHDSVTNENPHEDMKLSSASGMTQQRAHETLAEGRPGSTQPLANTRK